MAAFTRVAGAFVALLLAVGSAKQVQEDLCDALDPDCAIARGNTMLQRKMAPHEPIQLEEQSEEKVDWWSRRRKPAPTPSPPTHFIQFDASHKTPVPRIEAQGLIREALFSYPMDTMILSEDGESVQIPMGQFLESQYSRDTSVTNRSDFGVQKTMMFRSNKPSMLGDNLDLALLEKTHTLYSTVSAQDYPHHGKTKAEKEKAGRWSTTNRLAATSVARNARAVAANSFAGAGMGPQILQNSVPGDSKHVQAVRDYVATDGLKLSAAALRRMEQASKRLAERAAKAASKPIRSANACMHFEESPAISFSSDKVNIQLGKKLVAFRGRVMFAPNTEYDFLVGYAVFSHNAATNTLDMYFAGSSMLEVAERASGFEAKLWVGHADGAAWPMAPESRPPTTPMGRTARVAYSQMKALPIDYTLFDNDRSEVGCPDSALQALEESSEEVLATLGGSNPLSMIMHMTSTVPCGVEYLRPDSTGSAGYDWLEALGFCHFTMEVPPTIVAKSLAAHIQWNTIHGLPVSRAFQ